MNPLRWLKNLTETNQFISTTFDKIASTSLYTNIIQNKINQNIISLKRNQNYNIIIETTNFCNAQCVMCPHTTMKRPQKIMTETTFNTIINKIKKENIKPQVFILNGFGEPLTDPKIFSRIQKIKTIFPHSKIKLYSNLNLANEKTVQQIIDSHLDEINVSLNGYNAKNYQEVMNINYQKTINNLRKLINYKNTTNSKLIIRISMTLVKQNEKTVKKFIDKWSPLVNSVSVNKVHNYNGSTNDTTNKFKINFNKKTFPCRYLWDTINFDINGEIILCCLDYESQYKFGNIKSQSIKSAFNSSKFKLIRQQHLQLNSKKNKICCQCYTPYKNGVEWLFKKIY
jgi:radical SAM protein with 4Fe4S-binding SPASM domain